MTEVSVFTRFGQAYATSKIEMALYGANKLCFK